MRQLKETYHQLEICGPLDRSWRPVANVLRSEIYRDAHKLALTGRLGEALRQAEDAHLQEHGHMHDVEFRIVSTERTVTFLGGFDDANTKWES